jgi:hypothetical protein
MSQLDLSMVDPEPQPEAKPETAPTTNELPDMRPKIIIVWDETNQAPMVFHENCKTFEMQIAMLAAASNVIARRTEEARNNQAQAAMLNAMQNQHIAHQINNKHGGMPPQHRR